MVRRAAAERFRIAAVLAATLGAAACSIHGAAGETHYRCDDGVCPGGYDCVAGFCEVAGGGAADAHAAADAAHGIDASPAIDAAPDAGVTTIMIETAGDAFVRSGTQAAVNFGNDAHLEADLDAGGGEETETYLEFEIGAVGTIVHASLRLTCIGESLDGFDLDLADTAFDELTMTYQTTPTVVGGALATVPTIAATTVTDLDVTSVVTAGTSLTPTTVVFGVLALGTDGVDFAAKEAAAGHPTLVLEVTP